MIYRILMLPITLMLLIRQYYAEREAILQEEYFCECPHDCVLHETIKREQEELFEQAFTAITGLEPARKKSPGDYLQEMRDLECDVCGDSQRLDAGVAMSILWRKDWDENTPFGWCPECFPGAVFRWMGVPLYELDEKRLYNIVKAIERGTWATTGAKVGIRKRLELALRYELARRELTDGDIVKIEMANMKWEVEHKIQMPWG